MRRGRRSRRPATWWLVVLMGVSPPAHPQSGAASATAAATGGAAGSTIVGDRDTALGLTFTPWKDETAATFDRPPIRFDEPPAALDDAGVAQRAKNEAALSGYRRSRAELAR